MGTVIIRRSGSAVKGRGHVSLPHAILGLLAREPMTGYDLKTRWFDRSLRYFWPADQA